jgi:hypothetical protein
MVASKAQIQTTAGVRARSHKPAQPRITSKCRVNAAGGSMCRVIRGEATAMIAAEKVVEPKNIAMLCAKKSER